MHPESRFGLVPTLRVKYDGPSADAANIGPDQKPAPMLLGRRREMQTVKPTRQPGVVSDGSNHGAVPTPVDGTAQSSERIYINSRPAPIVPVADHAAQTVDEERFRSGRPDL